MRIDLDQVTTVDIETISRDDIDLVSAKAEIVEKNVQKYKTQAIIDSHVEEDYKDFIDKLPLDKFTSRIISISVMNDRYEKPKVFYNEDEKQLLIDFTNELVELLTLNNGIILSGYNFISFDMSQILYKLAKHNIKLDYPVFSNNKYDALDSFEMLGSKGSLEKTLKDMGIEGKYNGYTGKDVARLYNEGKFDEIIKYSEQDAKVEHILIMRLLSVYGYSSKKRM